LKAIQVSKVGRPEVLEFVDLPMPEPAPAEAVVEIEASGVNFVDVYLREGRYPARLPFIDGQEAAGIVREVGSEVRDFKAGDRVAYCSVLGSYAQYAAVAAGRLVSLPDALDFRQAAAAMLQGMTAHYLCHSTYPIRRGETALIHAAAGGVGALLTQMVKDKGARVIATAGSEDKAGIARWAGADEVIIYTRDDFEAETRRLTGDRGVDVVYDGVGKTTFDKDLNLLRPRGYLVLFGGASGAVPPFDPVVLSRKGSLFLTRPTLADYTRSREELEERAGDVFRMILSGKLELRIQHAYPLEEAAQAHRDLEARKSMGKFLLIP
jgi:NADPH:quinone reductase